MKREIAKSLLDIKAVFLSPLEPFTWASGIKSPIYCDNRITLSFPTVRKQIAKGLATLIKQHYPSCEVIMGTATAGIAHAALVSEELDLPMGYVRSSNKSHGRTNKIEGKLSKGDKVVVVEDLISTGGSCIEVVQTLIDAGAEVLGVVAIFSYNLEKGFQNFRNNNTTFATLSDYDTLVDVAIEQKYINQDSLKKLQKWKENPNDESWMRE